MYIEIDQSGQIGRQNTDTVLAFSNSEVHAIVITGRVKRALFARFKERYKEVREPYIKIFVAGLFLLLKDHLNRIEKILIDEEFTGKEGEIRGQLLNHIRTIRPEFTKDQVVFWRIGKKSGAHLKAIEIYRSRKQKRGRTDGYRMVTEREMLDVLRIK